MDRNTNENKPVWKLLVKLLSPFVRSRFNFDCDMYNLEGPCLVVANHVTTWDAIIMAVSFPNTPVHYVASEHLFRLGILSKLLSQQFDMGIQGSVYAEIIISPDFRKKGVSTEGFSPIAYQEEKKVILFG